MSSFWSRMRSNKQPPEERLSLDDWAGMFKYAGNTYGLTGLAATRTRGNYTTETVDSDFCGLVNDAYKASGVVFAVQLARMLVFTEMRFAYQKINDGRAGDLFVGPDLKILERPWPNGTTGDLLARAIQDTDFAGNHYVVRENDRLRRLRPDWVDIILNAPPDMAVQSDVVGYLYRPGGTEDKDLWQMYPVDGSMGEVAHWAPIPDPIAQYRGMSWLTPVIREIISDKSATQHKKNYFENAATPALAVSLDAAVTPEQFEEFMEKMDNAHGGVENAGKTLYLGGGADVTVIGANMQQMDFKSVQGGIETRIAAAARVHPTIVGLSEGLQGSSLNEGNYKAAKENFGTGTLKPLWRSLCSAYDVLVADQDSARLWYDDRDVSFMRQDRKDVAVVESQEALTITRLVMNGFTPDSSVQSVVEHDWRTLKHTGLYSVQLLPPELSKPDEKPDPNANPDPKDDGAEPKKPDKKVLSDDDQEKMAEQIAEAVRQRLGRR